ncbi:hypothetical protein [Stutzerimonas kunmingensis]|uniref:Uncharacterized protein n=1 Tax=Stutzerimonas kunmingensis TaxID=1211807 RepID=A0A9X1SQ71_9GAMM|nr:hypothetical protein [Stutzerimonas kunmingensis]MCD1608618.1 hypothetical protein [Stutzerimonas kunmingensis]
MNIIQRSLLSLRKFRTAVKKVFGPPGGLWLTCNVDSTATVGGTGATPGHYLTVTFPDSSTASTIVGASGAWSVTSAQLASCPSPDDLSVSTSNPANTAVIDSITVTPDGKYFVQGHGGRDKDTISFTIDDETYTLILDGSSVWFFTVEPKVPPKDLEPGDIDPVTDYVPPYVISIEDQGDGTHLVTGGGGKVGDKLTVVADGVEYEVTVTGADGWTAIVGEKIEDGIEVPGYVAPYVISITDNLDSTFTVVGGGGRAGDRLTVTINGQEKLLVTNTDSSWSVIVDMSVPGQEEVDVGSDYIPPYVTEIIDNLDGTHTVNGAGGKAGDTLTVTIKEVDYTISLITTGDTWSVTVTEETVDEEDVDVGSDYIHPYVISITDNGNSTYTIIGAGGRAGDVLTVTVEGRQHSITTTADDAWSLTLDLSTPAPGDVDVGTDYVQPYIISITDNGQTFTVLGGGGRPDEVFSITYDTVIYPITIPAEGTWTVEVTKKAPPVVEVPDTYVQPYVISVTNNFDGTYTVIGGGGRAGDLISISIDGNLFQAEILTDNSWEITFEFTRTVDLEDVVVIVRPDELDGFVTAADAVYADYDVAEFVECADDGSYISWEAFVEHLKSIVGIDTTALDTVNFDAYGAAKKVLRSGERYIAAFDEVYLIFGVVDNVVVDVQTIEKNYMTGRDCDVFRTEHGIYYFKKDGVLDRLTRLDGAESDVVLDITSRWDTGLPALVTLGDREWLVNADFSISYLIDPLTLEHTQGPVFSEIEIVHQGTLNEAVSADGRVFAVCRHKVSGYYGIYELNSGGFIQLLSASGNLAGGNGSLYVFNTGGVGDLVKIDLATGQQKTLASQGGIVSGFVFGDFGVFLRGNREGLLVTYDAGETFEDLLHTPGFSGLKHIDCDGDRIIITKQWDTYTLQTYNLIKL